MANSCVPTLGFVFHSKACNHPYMLLDVEPGLGETEEQAVDNMVAASGKLALLDRMLPRLKVRCSCCCSGCCCC